MRFFASWWERFPWREAAPPVLMALAAVVLLDNADTFINALFGPFGFVWG